MSALNLESAYEELLRESCQTIVDLRFELSQQKEILESWQKRTKELNAIVNGSLMVDAMSDDFTEDDWSWLWPEEYETSCCGAPCSKDRAENGGRCGMPCI